MAASSGTRSASTSSRATRRRPSIRVCGGSSTLNTAKGLFKVADGIYQVRGYDIANMTLVEGADRLDRDGHAVTAGMARAALKLAMAHRPKTKPVVAVIYTHSHTDHYGGVRGVVDEADVGPARSRSSRPAGFMEDAVGRERPGRQGMSRRAMYMYGDLPRASAGAGGLRPGQGAEHRDDRADPADATSSTRPARSMTIDGVRIVFQLAPGTEAPAEMHCSTSPT